VDIKIKEEQSILLKRIKAGEGDHLDFKFAVNDSRKLAITLSAFCNAGGGSLFIGVKDNGSISGIQVEEELHMVQGAAELYCLPPVPFQFHVHVLNGKHILEATFEESQQKPVKALEKEGEAKAYIRVGAENRLASPVMIQYWQTERKSLTGTYQHTTKSKKIFDTLLRYPGATLNQLCKATRIFRPVLIKVLANLVRWELIEIRYLQDKEHFYARE
jgi:predicted HTH transcriptional regulator